MKGVYSIAEAVDDSNKHPIRTIFCVLNKDEGDLLCTTKFFSKGELKSLTAVADMVRRNGGVFCDCLEDVACYLNGGL